MTKPTGHIGPTRIAVVEGGNLDVTFEQVSFPQSKDEIESQVVEHFLRSAKKALSAEGETFLIVSAKKNPEPDFDFSVETKQGPGYLELMELAPLELFGGGYDKAPPKYKPYDLAQNVVSKVLAKSRRYSGNTGRPLFLLIYVTHWKFEPSESTVALLRYFCTKQPHTFGAIFLFSPIDEIEGLVRWLYPVPPEFLAGFDPERFRDNEVLNFDPAKWHAIKGGS